MKAQATATAGDGEGGEARSPVVPAEWAPVCSPLSAGYSPATAARAQARVGGRAAVEAGAPLPASLAPGTAPASPSPGQPGALRTDPRCPAPGQTAAGSLLSPQDSPLPYRPPHGSGVQGGDCSMPSPRSPWAGRDQAAGWGRGRRGGTLRKRRHRSRARVRCQLSGGPAQAPGRDAGRSRGTAGSPLRRGHQADMPSLVRGDPGGRA